MSTRTRLAPFQVLTAVDMTGSHTSIVTGLGTITHVCYFLTWSGTAPVGTAMVQVSADYSAQGGVVINAGTWNTLTLTISGSPSQSVPITGTPGTASIDIITAAPYVRLVYTPTSGTGTLTAYVSGKVA